MRTFADKSGTEWKIDLTFGAVVRVKSLSNGRFDLMRPDAKVKHEELGDTTLQVVLMLDMATFWEVLYFVLEPQCVERGVNAAQFGERMASNSLVSARDAFREEWRDFFQGLQRPDQVLALEKMGVWLKAATEKLTAKTKSLNMTAIDQAVTEAMDSTLASTSGKLEEALASIRDSSHGASLTG